MVGSERRGTPRVEFGEQPRGKAAPGVPEQHLAVGPGVPRLERRRLFPSGPAAAAATTALVALCCLAIALVIAAPLAAAAGSGAAQFLYLLFEPVCHQIAERSFHAAGHPLAVCHRCFGFYVGFTAGLALLPFFRPARDWLLEQPRRILLFLGPAAIDWVLPMNTPTSRFSTAVLAAAPIAVLVWAAIGQTLERTAPKLTEETR